MEYGYNPEQIDSPERMDYLFVNRRHEVANLLQRCFEGAPWFENISDEVALARVESHAMKPGFDAILTLENDKIVAGLWYDTPSIEELREERGEDLADFAQTTGADRVIWEREVVVHPDYQGHGLATKLRQQFLDRLTSDDGGRALLLTRMRDDNPAIIAVAQKFDYERTGIRIPSSQNPDVSHEYWHRIIDANE